MSMMLSVFSKRVEILSAPSFLTQLVLQFVNRFLALCEIVMMLLLLLGIFAFLLDAVADIFKKSGILVFLANA